MNMLNRFFRKLFTGIDTWLTDHRLVFCAGCGRLVFTGAAHTVRHVSLGWVWLCDDCWHEHYAPYHSKEEECLRN